MSRFSEIPSITDVLTELADVLQKPIHFVLGNDQAVGVGMVIKGK